MGGFEAVLPVAPGQTLDGKGAIDNGQHHAADDVFYRLVDDENIFGVDAGALHAVAVDADEIGGGWMLDTEFVEIEGAFGPVGGGRGEAGGNPAVEMGQRHGLRGLVGDDKGQGVVAVAEGRRSGQVIAHMLDKPFNRINKKHLIDIHMFSIWAKIVNGNFCLRRTGAILFYSHIKQGA